MSAQFIGSKISLISKSEIRYEGILYTIDPKESTIALAKVRSFGTEDRVTDKPVAPRSEVYEYIIFRASDIKDLLVDDPPAQSPALADPAIIQAQSVAASGSNSFPGGFASSGSSALTSSASAGQPARQGTLSSVLGRASPVAEKPTSRRSSPGVGRAKSPSENQTGDHRAGQKNESSRVPYSGRSGGSNVNNNFRNNRQGQPPRNQSSNRRNNNQPQSDWPARQAAPGTNRNRARPTMLDVRKLEEFDFEKANAEFVELTKEVEDLKISDGKDEEAPEEQKKENLETYNKAKSFFDSISCEAIERQKGNMTRVDRRQERKLNQETFGVSGVYNRNWNRNGQRMPPRNNQRRDYNQGGRGGGGRNGPGQGGRRYVRNSYGNSNNNFGGGRSRNTEKKSTQEPNSNSTGTGNATVWGPAQ